jgi:2-polyprenyl-3-methyl-5-hydroxy-6-metoxy-1,4-benzoquinol methylase
MENTGERHIISSEFTDAADYYIHLLHIASYEFALKYVDGKRVLDYGCGSGYGSHMLANKAESVMAVDISSDTVTYAKKNFVLSNLIFKEIKDLVYQKFDVITSFQVIEHVSNDKEYIKKLKDMLNPGGVLLLTTPDKTNRLFNYIQKPWNVYHRKEYSENNMNKLLNNYFDNFQILKITSLPGLVLPEITRRKKQRLITLPCTLFFYPNFLRVFLLKFEAKTFKIISRLWKRDSRQILSGAMQKETSFIKFTSKDIEISQNPKYPTDLFIICKLSV